MSSNKEWLRGDSIKRCPTCDQPFDPAYTNGWCPYFECGEYQVPAYRPGETESSKCPQCGEEIQPDYEVCPWCGEKLSTGISTGISEPSPGDLLAEGELRLDINGQKLTLSPGDTLGENIRIVLRSQGKRERIYKQIHSEHARVFESGGTLLLQKEGKNSLTLDGREIERGEVRPISDGDEIGFSDVVTAEITIL